MCICLYRLANSVFCYEFHGIHSKKDRCSLCEQPTGLDLGDLHLHAFILLGKGIGATLRACVAQRVVKCYKCIFVSFHVFVQWKVQ